MSEAWENARAGLKSIYFVDEAGIACPENAGRDMNKGDGFQFRLKGKLQTGEEVDLERISKRYDSSSAAAVFIDVSGKATALEAGASMVTAAIDLADGSALISPYFWLYVHDLQELLAESLVALASLSHPSMETAIGKPAVLKPGDDYPAVTVRANAALQMEGAVVRDGKETVAHIPAEALAKGQEKRFSFAGKVPGRGQYEIRLTLTETDKRPVYDTFAFAALQPDDVPAGQSGIAFLNNGMRLVYVPDYRGNRILDFSNCGYMGGGVRIPDVQAKAIVKPVQGDATAVIQAAIDQVSSLPIGKDGFRGAVVLTKGRYDVAGTLRILASGVVLRGEGEGKDRTLIYGTGTARRNLIEVGSGSGPMTDSASAVEISDLYVPAGSRTFHVSDASGYEVGDAVIVRRIGNGRWIGEIGMDRIFMRPGVVGATRQWTPFNLDFDRIITAVDGNRITVDAPIANAIDRRWGGGQLLKYSDIDRIEQVGVENLQADSDYDPSVIDTVMDNDATDPYFADENHAERFVAFDGVKNGWARNLTACRLSYSLVRIGWNAKWITVQDSTMKDHVSIITGGRRYSIHIQGQLNVAQRIYVETSRHSFVFDSHVCGPNVFLDCSDTMNFNTSEPHHRWSTGGLYDGVRADISIRDRVWLGSGHGWAGANYVTWNTEGALTSQQPPTAQNYAIGHVGTVVPGLVPNAYDPRPRSEAYWDRTGRHVAPASLYKQQLAERLGVMALDQIQP